MFEQLKSLIAYELSVPKESITPETDLQNDLGADSLDAIELIMSVENTFKITIPEAQANNLRTVGDLLRFIEKSQ